VSLSASIPVLKSKARRLRRTERIPLYEALNRIAMAEGYRTWSLLVANAGTREGGDLLERLDAGDLVLLGARPGQGKTLCALQLLISSLRCYQQGWFFSLQNDAPNINAMFEHFGENRSSYDAFVFEHSDEIDAQYIVEKIQGAAKRTIVVVDHLQLLDQRRKAPELQQQVSDLNAFAKRAGCIVVLISQIRSAFDGKSQRLPTVEDVRLLDTLDFGIFDKLLFLQDGQLQLGARAK
jgi:replicative DNA helicase